jgi:TonB family protein
MRKIGLKRLGIKMNNKTRIVAYSIGLSFAVFSGTTIAAQRPPMPLAVNFVQEPCASFNLSKYSPVHQRVMGHIWYPKAALDARINGYAGVEFQLDATGVPRNIKVVCEQPTGYGIGEAFVEALRQEKFEPTPGLDEWHYQNISLGVDTPPPPSKH